MIWDITLKCVVCFQNKEEREEIKLLALIIVTHNKSYGLYAKADVVN